MTTYQLMSFLYLFYKSTSTRFFYKERRHKVIKAATLTTNLEKQTSYHKLHFILSRARLYFLISFKSSHIKITQNPSNYRRQLSIIFVEIIFVEISFVEIIHTLDMTEPSQTKLQSQFLVLFSHRSQCDIIIRTFIPAEFHQIIRINPILVSIHNCGSED